MRYKIGPKHINTFSKGIVYSIGLYFKILIILAVSAMICVFGTIFIVRMSRGLDANLEVNLVRYYLYGVVTISILLLLALIKVIVPRYVHNFFECSSEKIIFLNKFGTEVVSIKYSEIHSIKFMKGNFWEVPNYFYQKDLLWGYIRYRKNSKVFWQVISLGSKNECEVAELISFLKTKIPSDKITVSKS